MRKYFFAFVAMTALAQVHSAEFPAAQINKLEIKNPKGEVVITGMKNARKISVSIEKIKFDPKCKFNSEVDSGILKLSVEHESGLFEKSNCEAKILIEAPSSLSAVEASTSVGHLKMTGMDSAVDFKTSTGNVEISGDTLKAVTGKTATGHISLSYLNCPKRADIDLISATGDAEVHLGSICKIRVAHKSATGELFNEIGDSEDFQVQINMKSASGGLKIKKRAK